MKSHFFPFFSSVRLLILFDIFRYFFDIFIALNFNHLEVLPKMAFEVKGEHVLVTLTLAIVV